MATVTTASAQPKSYRGRHTANRPKGPRLARRIYDWMFGKEEHVKATVSDLVRIPDNSLFVDAALEVDALETEIKATIARRKAELEDYMIPYVNALDEIMNRFRAGLAVV